MQDLSQSLLTSHSALPVPYQLPQQSKTHPPGTVADLTHVLKHGDNHKLKSFIRSNHWWAGHEIRSCLWHESCNIVFKMRDDHALYEDLLAEVFGLGDSQHEVTLPSFVDPSTMLHYHLCEGGVHAAKRMLCVISTTCPDVTFGPGIFALTCLLLHYMSESSTYTCVYNLLRSKDRYVAQTKIAYQAASLVMKDLTKIYAKSCWHYLRKRGLAVQQVFDNWLWWIMRHLPFPYLIRVIDCYLSEGPKVLYRAALAILILFHKLRVKGGKVAVDEGVNTAICQFCEDLTDFISVDGFLRVAFGIRGLSRKQIRKLMTKEEMYVTSTRHVAAMPHNLPTSASCDSLNMKVSRSFSLQHTAMDEVDGSGQLGQRGRSSSQTIQTMLPFNTTQSSVLSITDWLAVWGWLPTRITLYTPQLIYTTAEHGTSLLTFFNRVDGHEPTLLVVKTSSNQVFGAYCSTDWTERKGHNKTRSFFGTGESFLFTTAPSKQRYPWVGTKLGVDTPKSANLFQSADNKQIVVGGGGGGEALWLDENLYQGHSQHCTTFDNPSLSDPSDFLCTTIEVFSFN